MELFLLWDILFYFNDNLFILGEKEKRKREIIEKIEDGKKEREWKLWWKKMSINKD